MGRNADEVAQTTVRRRLGFKYLLFFSMFINLFWMLFLGFKKTPEGTARRCQQGFKTRMSPGMFFFIIKGIFTLDCM